jgi:branched-chain amino acid transport system ATP-binding protein
MSAVLLHLESVGVHFGALKAVDQVSFDLHQGERVAILGPNGAGKTTLFNAITGMNLATQGEIYFANKSITKASPNYRAQLGIARTFQITNLFFGLSVEDNLLLAIRGLQKSKFSFWRSNQPISVEESIIQSALTRCRLNQQRKILVKDISYGEQRQLELAMSLTSSPKVLLLDEPAAGLSPAERVVMAEVIQDLPQDLAMILIEHDIELALGLVDRVICMYQGSILVEGKPDEIRGNQQVQEIYLGKPRHARSH